MDKFGIFNILNSFLGSLNGKNGETKDSSSDSPDYLKTISSFFDNANSAKNSEKHVDIPKTGEKSGEYRNHAPLQSSMLATMKSHDNFVNRVLSSKSSKNK